MEEHIPGVGEIRDSLEREPTTRIANHADVRMELTGEDYYARVTGYADGFYTVWLPGGFEMRVDRETLEEKNPDAPRVPV